MHTPFQRGGIRFGLLIGFTLVLGLTGCGKGRGVIKGKVYFNNAPLKGGNVTFVAKDGKGSSSAAIQEDGSFEASRVPKGEVKILIETESLNPRTARPITYAPPKDQSGSGYSPPGATDLSKRYIAIPPLFAKEDQSPLTMTVTGGNQEYDIKFP